MGLQDFKGNNPNNTVKPQPSIPNAFLGLDQDEFDTEEYCIDYNKKFKTAGKTLFREKITQQLISILIGKIKPNALLVGQAGVGKTNIVEDLAYRIANNDPLIPDKLKGHTIYELPLSNILVGTNLRGQMEEKMKAILDFMSDPANKAILFIDEIHQLCTQRNSNYTEIAQILKPALARGQIKVIGATTLQESRQFAKDPAFNRRFSRIIVDELTKTQTVEILRKLKGEFFLHYDNRIFINDNTLTTICNLADEYKQVGSHRPDNAITLMDRAFGDALVHRKKMEESAKNDPALLAAIQSVPYISLNENQIRKTAIKLMTGNSKKETLNMESLTRNLQRIKGQDDVIAKVKDIIQKHDLGLFYYNNENTNNKKPLSLLFAGPSGVGKTEITKILAKELTDEEPIILNMTEYQIYNSIDRILGAPPGYAGHDNATELPLDVLDSNPYRVILLDEFEKGHKSIQTLFMQALDEGYIKNNSNKIIDFSKAIIIITTNASHTNVTGQVGFHTGNKTAKKQETIKSLSKWFPVELLNRFYEILTFHPLDKDIYREILTSKYTIERDRIRNSRKRITLPDAIPDEEIERIIEETYVTELGARPAERAIQDYIEDLAVSQINAAAIGLPESADAPTEEENVSKNDTGN